MTAEQIAVLYFELCNLSKKSENTNLILDIENLIVDNGKKGTIVLFKESVTRLSTIKQDLSSEVSGVWEIALSTQVKESVTKLKRLGE